MIEGAIIGAIIGVLVVLFKNKKMKAKGTSTLDSDIIEEVKEEETKKL